MATRLWFVLSLAWAVLFFANYSTRAPGASPLDRFDYLVALLPFAAGLVLRIAYRYVRYGPRLR